MALPALSLGACFPREGRRARLALRDATDGTITLTVLRSRDGVEAGTVVLRAEDAALVVDELAISEAYRGYGLGSDTAAMLRELAAEGGYGSLRAWAPPAIGLAVYFWVRMGLRPLFGEGPAGGIWFERRL